jgi:hypothetical protein
MFDPTLKGRDFLNRVTGRFGGLLTLPLAILFTLTMQVIPLPTPVDASNAWYNLPFRFYQSAIGCNSAYQYWCIED